MKKLLSLLVTLALLGCTLPVAAEEPVTIPGPVVVEGGTTEKITGDVEVSGDGKTAVTASGSGSKAVVTGSATSTGGESIGAYAIEGGTVEVGGSATAGNSGYGAYAADSYTDKDNNIIGSSVNVGGDATAGDNGYGAYAENINCLITVTNDATAGDSGTGVYAENGGAVEVGSDASAGDWGKGVWVVNGSVTVGENVIASEYGIGIDFRQNSLVSVGGSVSANVGAVISTNDGDGSGALVVEGRLSGAERDIQIEGVTGVLPDIVVGTLGNGTEPILVIAEGSTVTFDDIIGAIRYIVNAQGMTVAAGTYENRLTGAVYDVAAEGDEVTVQAAARSGYRLTSLNFGSYADVVVDNGDGTYTVTVLRGGNLNFEAVFEKIKEEEEKEQEKEEKSGFSAPKIRVTFDEETLEVSAENPAVKASVTCSNMAYAQKQFATATFMLDGEAKDAKYFTVTLDAEGRLEIALAEELRTALEPGAHSVEMRLANGKVIRFEITVA